MSTHVPILIHPDPTQQGPEPQTADPTSADPAIVLDMVATRASDADRDRCLEDIETAYVDGRIDAAERESRTQAALQATTVAELDDLVADLAPTPAPASRPGANLGGAISRRTLVAVLIGGVVAAVAAVTIWLATTGDDDAESAVPVGTPTTQVPEGKLELHSAEGFEQLVAAIKDKFGTTVVASAAIYPDYASIEVVTPDDPRRAENWYFSKGFEGEPSKGTRPAGAKTVDLAEVDATAYAKAVRRSPVVLGVEDVNSTYAVIRDNGDGPTFSVYVSNAFRENGYWTFTVQGKELRRYAFE
jgi:hypothetical protein